MKVIQVIDSLKVGGAQKLMVVFAQEMLRKKHSVMIISLCGEESESPIYRELKRLNVEIVHIPLRSITDAAAFKKLRQTIQSSGADIVHTQLNYANIYGTLSARRVGLPSVASLHNASVHLYHYKPYRTWLETVSLRLYARRIIACGHTVARVQQPRFGRKVLWVIPNPVPAQHPITNEQIQSRRATFLPGRKGLLVISVGRLIPEKGYSDLIQAFKIVREKNDQPMRLLIAGMGYLMDDLRAEASAAGLQDTALFLGERSDVPELLAASDIYAGASHYEGQSLAVLEAMQNGLAVIVTDVGDNRQVVANNCGVVLPAGRIDLMAGEILRLARDPQERKRLGNNASQSVKINYSPTVWVDRLLDLYAEVLHG